MAEPIVTLKYDLYSLPTAQHKAGLAGLCVLMETLKRRRIAPLPAMNIDDEGMVTVSLTKETLTTLFNDLYDAGWEEVAAKQKRKDKNKVEIKPLREEKRTEDDPKTQKGKDITCYIYKDVIPKAAFLESIGAPEVWLKLWRESIWKTLRGVPLTRIPYNERAEGKPVNEVEKVWKGLLKLAKSPHATEKVASSLFVGAQEFNAEKVPFGGRVDENFLLHFWQVVMRVFVPETMKIDGKREFVGYVLTIPEVCDLEGFVEEFCDMTAQLKPDLAGYRPAEAVVSIPQEGALEYIAGLVRSKAHAGAIAYNIASVELYHLNKPGNSVVTLMSGRLPVDDLTRKHYEAIRGQYRHPLYRMQMIRNLLDGREWYSGFDRLMSARDKDWFIGSKSWFPNDVMHHFNIEKQS